MQETLQTFGDQANLVSVFLSSIKNSILQNLLWEKLQSYDSISVNQNFFETNLTKT